MARRNTRPSVLTSGIALASRKLHPSARTNRRQRRLIQQSRDSDKARAAKMGLNVKTVAKWRRRETVDDAPHGRQSVPPTGLTDQQVVFVVAVRQLTRGSLDTLLPRLSEFIPGLSRSALYRAWRKWGVSRVPRIAPPRDFALAKDVMVASPGGEAFVLRAFRIVPDDKRVLLFIVGQNSGWLRVRVVETWVYGKTAAFLEEALNGLQKSSPATSMIKLTTPMHRAFCDEEYPASPEHFFSRVCYKRGIKQEFETAEPVPIGFLQKGWPGFERSIRKSPRRTLRGEASALSKLL